MLPLLPLKARGKSHTQVTPKSHSSHTQVTPKSHLRCVTWSGFLLFTSLFRLLFPLLVPLDQALCFQDVQFHLWRY